MPRALDLVGHRNGRLVVLARAENHIAGGRRRSRWLCQCDCGKQVLVLGGNLTGKDACAKSCGCLRREVGITRGHQMRAAATRKRAAALAQAEASLRWRAEVVLPPRDRPPPTWGRKTREALADLAACLGYMTGGRR